MMLGSSNLNRFSMVFSLEVNRMEASGLYSPIGHLCRVTVDSSMFELSGLRDRCCC